MGITWQTQAVSSQVWEYLKSPQLWWWSTDAQTWGKCLSDVAKITPPSEKHIWIGPHMWQCSWENSQEGLKGLKSKLVHVGLGYCWGPSARIWLSSPSMSKSTGSKDFWIWSDQTGLDQTRKGSSGVHQSFHHFTMSWSSLIPKLTLKTQIIHLVMDAFSKTTLALLEDLKDGTREQSLLSTHKLSR